MTPNLESGGSTDGGHLRTTAGAHTPFASNPVEKATTTFSQTVAPLLLSNRISAVKVKNGYKDRPVSRKRKSA